MEPLTARLNLGIIPGTPLPFYVRSAGQHTVKRGRNDFSPSTRNPFVEIIFSMEGQGEIIHYEKSFQLGPGDVFYFMPNEDHLRRAISTSWNIRWLTFDGPLADAVMMSFRLSRLQTFDMEPVIKIMDDIDQNIGNSSSYAVKRMSGLVYILLTLIGGGQEEFHSTQLQKRCIEAIKNHLSNQNLSIAMLCDLLETPRSTLCKAFREKTGKSIGSYIKSMRSIQARSLLRNSNLSIKEIADRCGITSASSFTRLIRRECGMSPQKYRNKSDETATEPNNNLQDFLPPI